MLQAGAAMFPVGRRLSATRTTDLGQAGQIGAALRTEQIPSVVGSAKDAAAWEGKTGGERTAENLSGGLG